MFEVLFQYGPFTLRTFNLFLAIAFLLGIYLLLRTLSRNKMNTAFLTAKFMWLALIALAGGRIFYLFEHLTTFKSNPLSFLYIWDLKFSAFGMLYAGIAGLYFFTKKEQEDFWLWLDGISISTIAALVFINIGYFFNGSNYGIPTDLPWGISFENINIPFTTPIHPTQLYSALLALGIYLFIVKYNRRTHLSGMVASIAIMLYSLGTLGIDFIREASGDYVKVNLAIIAALAFIAYVNTSHKSHLTK